MNQTTIDFIIQNLYLLPVILISITMHEFMHGFISYKLGDPTAKAMGRLTLNPIKHIDPVGFLMMFIAHIGWAKPVPINPEYYKNRKGGTILVSIAGPLTNLIIAFLFSAPYFYITMKYNMIVDITYKFTAIDMLHDFSFLFMILNIGLAVFNLIPVPPLDGSKILSGILPTQMYFSFMKYEKYIGIMFLFIVIVFPGSISTIMDPIRNFLFQGFYDIWRPLLNLVL
jgi:Zn-dependent protease